MKIDVNAFLQSLPIMGVGLLGIFIVTGVIIVGIYILKALTKNSKDDEEDKKDEAKSSAKDTSDDKEASAKNEGSKKKGSKKKESAMDLMKEREKKDFLEEVDNNYISKDL